MKAQKIEITVCSHRDPDKVAKLITDEMTKMSNLAEEDWSGQKTAHLTLAKDDEDGDTEHDDAFSPQERSARQRLVFGLGLYVAAMLTVIAGALVW